MNKLTALFLYAFVADGLIGALAILGGSPLLGLLAAFSMLAVLLFALLLFVGMVITPRLSKRILLPPILFLVFAVGWSAIYGANGVLLVTLAEAMLGLGLLVGYKDRTGTSAGGLQAFCSTRPIFTLRNFIFTGLLNGAIACFVMLLVTLGLTQKILFNIEDATGRFMTIQSGGIAMDERVFRLGDREIRLLGMMHIAKSGFYDEVAKSLPTASRTMVLLEGVRDRDNRLKGTLDYKRMARLFGFTSQKDSSFTKKAREGLEETTENRAQGKTPKNLEYQIADVDLADFRPETIRFIQILGKLISSETMKEAVQTYSESKAELQANSIHVWDDILNKRNDHLIAEIGAGLKTHTTIIVPWGAAHMPEVQKQIEKWGFVETKRTRHLVVPFQNKMLVALISLLGRIPDASPAI